MENVEKNFVINAHHTISQMPSRYNGYTWSAWNVSFRINGDTLETRVGSETFTDALPKKGNRRDRNSIANIVCGHICDAWGGTFDEITAYCEAFFADLHKILNA